MSGVWDELAARSVALGRPLDEVVRHHLLEGVLRRLARQPHAVDFVLRGSMLTRAWIAPRPRVAGDLDFVGTFAPGVAETLRRFVPVLDATDIADGVCLNAASCRARALWPTTAFPGVRLFVRAGLSGVEQEFQIDVGFNDPLVPSADLLRYPTLLPGPPAPVWAVRPETAVAWKLHGLAEMGPHGWRPKDLHDVDSITQAMPLVTTDLTAALEAAFVSRGYAVTDAEGVFTRPNWWQLKSARVKWAEYGRAQDNQVNGDDLLTVVRRVHDRLRPALRALSGGREQP